MPRKKCYGSEAEKQRAYRLRKAGLVLVEKKAVFAAQSRETDEVPPDNLPVPVLAEPRENVSSQLSREQARESTPSSTNDDKLAPLATKAAPPNADSDSRGGRTLSSTDQKFEEDRLGWYIFGKLEKEKNCWKCGKKYSTRLEMGRFCTPKCKTAYLDSASHLRQRQ